VTESSALLALSNDPVWFCLRAEPKREHLAAVALRRRFGIECLSPRLRFRKLTQRGPVWFVEAMFPGYLLRNLSIPLSIAQLKAPTESGESSGLENVWQRCRKIPSLRFSQRRAPKKSSLSIPPQNCQPVQLIEGPFRGLEVLVTQLLPARERIRVLLEFLGRSLEWKFLREKCSQPNRRSRTKTKWPSRGTATLLPSVART